MATSVRTNFDVFAIIVNRDEYSGFSLKLVDHSVHGRDSKITGSSSKSSMDASHIT